MQLTSIEIAACNSALNSRVVPNHERSTVKTAIEALVSTQEVGKPYTDADVDLNSTQKAIVIKCLEASDWTIPVWESIIDPLVTKLNA